MELASGTGSGPMMGGTSGLVSASRLETAMALGWGRAMESNSGLTKESAMASGKGSPRGGELASSMVSAMALEKVKAWVKAWGRRLVSASEELSAFLSCLSRNCLIRLRSQKHQGTRP